MACPSWSLRPKARPFTAGMGARSGVTPERPSRRQTFDEGQDAPGIHRVVRRPLAILGNPLPEHLPASMSAMPSTSGPKPPAAFPVGYAARGLVSPSLTTGKPDATPALSQVAPAVRTKGTRAPEAVADRRPNPHFHIHKGVLQLEPDRFHPYPRAPAHLTG